MNFEKKEVSDLLPPAYPTGRASQFLICIYIPQMICISRADIRAISNTLISGKAAMKWAALLNGPGSLLRSMKFIARWTGRKSTRNNPARAITNFLEIDEKIILFIGGEKIRVCAGSSITISKNIIIKSF